MNRRVAALAAPLLLAATVLVSAGAGAQSPTPSVVATATPFALPDLRSTGTLVVQTKISGTPVTVGGNVAFYHKGTFFRLDVLSLGIPGASGDLSALASSFIAPGGLSGLFNTASGEFTVWSNANRNYYTSTPLRRATSAPSARPSASAPPRPFDPFAMFGSVVSSLRDVQSASIQLVGHAPVNGHPATSLDFQMKRQPPAKALESYHAQIALADDLGEFPLQIVLQSTPADPSAIGGTLKLDLTSVQADAPDDAMFRVPAGYARAATMGAVLGSLPKT